jgi:hypothetical protein
MERPEIEVFGAVHGDGEELGEVENHDLDENAGGRMGPFLTRIQDVPELPSLSEYSGEVSIVVVAFPHRESD